MVNTDVFFKKSTPRPEITDLPKGTLKKKPITQKDVLKRMSQRKTNFKPLATYEEARKLFWQVIKSYQKRHGITFEVDDNNREILRALCAYFSLNEGELELSKGVCLMGSVGTGKTVLMKICKQFAALLQNKTHGFFFDSCRDVFNEVSFNGDISILNKYRNHPRCFDDLGQEPRIFKHFGNDVSVMELIISKRYDLHIQSHRITHFTTNLNFKELGEVYGERIEDRMKEMCNVIVLDGQSRRR